MRQLRTPYLALLGSVALSLSACSSITAVGDAKTRSAPSATSATARTTAVVYQQMRRSATGAKSVHIKGVFTDRGQQTQLDVAGDLSGTSMRMSVNFGAGVIEVLKVHGDFYLKADAAYWTRLEGSAATARTVADKYVKVPAGSAAGMGDFRLGTLLDKVFAEDISTAGVLNTKVQATDVVGMPAYLMTAKAGGDAKLYVSADGQARLLRAEGTKDGTLEFTEWDSVVPTLAPPADQQAKTPSL
jgi:hypothetical protein